MIPTSSPAIPVDTVRDSFRHDVLEGLKRPQKTIPCKYLYDARGSELFEAITRLDAYYPTRTETAILEAHGNEMAACAGPAARIVEYGSGSSEKTILLLDRLHRPAAYVPIDISQASLDALAAHVRQRFPGLHVAPVHADYTEPFELPRTPGRRTVVFFPGSTLGNFDPPEAQTFLASMARAAGPHGALIVGVDLRKDEATLERAYDDEEGVTAAFNLNLLTRINRELEGTFDLSRFRHRAVWDDHLGRVEMHLVSLEDQRAEVAGETISFREGETIHTENSYKYGLSDFAALAARTGLAITHRWTDAAQRFGVFYLVPKGEQEERE